MSKELIAITFKAKIKPVKPINEQFTLCKCFVMAIGKNVNKTIISKESVDDALPIYVVFLAPFGYNAVICKISVCRFGTAPHRIAYILRNCVCHISPKISVVCSHRLCIAGQAKPRTKDLT